MGRHVKPDWYLDFLKAKAIFAEGGNISASEVAHKLKIRPKTMSRILIAGRFVDRYRPNLSPEQVRCSYVSMEYLEKIMRISPDFCQDLIPAALSNQLKIHDLRKHLDELRFKYPLQVSDFNRRSDRRRDNKTAKRQFLELLPSLDPAVFGVPNGTYHQVATNLYYSTTAIVKDPNDAFGAALFVKVGGESKDFRAMAMEFFEFAVLRKSVVPIIWLIFPRRTEIFLCLAEIKLHFQDKILREDQQWLRLAYLGEEDGKNTLIIFDQEQKSQLEQEIFAGKRLFEPKDLELVLKPLPVKG